jgi:hypothetical protein
MEIMMIPTLSTDTLTENVLRNIQGAFAEQYLLTDDGSLVAGPTYVLPGLEAYGLLLPDLILGALGWAPTEVNVSNGAGTSAHHADLPRVAHELDTIEGRGLPLGRGTVVLRPFSPDTRSTPEITIRSALLAAGIEERFGIPARTITAEAMPPVDAAGVVTDSIPAIARQLEFLPGTGLFFRGARVAFLNNPNLLSEFARVTGTPLAAVLDQLGDDVIHEGVHLAGIGFDKVLQQRLADGTGLQSLACRVLGEGEDVAVAAVEMARRHGAAVLKPSGTSGGIAVIPVTADTSVDDLRIAVTEAERALARKYGENWDATFCWGIYEFIDALPARGRGGASYRWDLRFEVLIRPESTCITPLSARLAPSPISDKIDRANAVVNQTDRAKGAGEAINPVELCRRLGLHPSILEDAARSIWNWAEAAMRS